MSPVLIVHICAGAVAILSGAIALAARKGAWLHRLFGTVFFLSMLIMLLLGAWLAATAKTSVVIPRVGTVAVALLTLTLVISAWLTVRQKSAKVGFGVVTGVMMSSSLAITLAWFGVQAAMSPTGVVDGAPALAYYGFASFAALLAVLDMKVILRGGISGAPRIARHLWRMCAALLFATTFFFLGQGQKVMPSWMQGSPWLYIPGLAPLALMVFWLIRVRLTRWYKPEAVGASSIQE